MKIESDFMSIQVKSLYMRHLSHSRALEVLQSLGSIFIEMNCTNMVYVAGLIFYPWHGNLKFLWAPKYDHSSVAVSLKDFLKSTWTSFAYFFVKNAWRNKI